MDMHAAYREVGSYRAAAEICGTTPKTVKRSVLEAAKRPRPGRVPGGRAQLRRVGTLWPSGWHAPRAGSRPSGCCRWPEPPATAVRPATSAGWWPRRRPSGKRQNHRGRRPGVWAPGDMVVFDWGEIGPLFVFCAVVAWSRVRFVSFADNLGAEATMTALAECFEYIGGCRRPRSPIGWAV